MTDRDKPAPAFGGRLLGTEGIRGSLCLLIVWYHVYLYTSPTGPPSRGALYTLGITRLQLGLSVFFILSAFLLYRPFVQSLLRGRPRPAFRAYLGNRVLRIMPVYWVVLGITALIGSTVVWVPRHDWDFHLPTFAANIFLVHGLHPSGVQTGVPPAWSLAVEWGFYLLLPLLVMIALAAGGRAVTRRRRLAAALIPAGILFVIGMAGRELSRRTVTPEDPSGVLNTWHAVVERSFPAWADLFAMGMLLAVLRVQFEDRRLSLPWWWRRAALAAWVIGAWALVVAQDQGRLNYHYYNLLIGIPLALFVAAVVLWDGDPRRDVLMRILEWRPFVWLGEMSLSVYLIHYPVIVWMVDNLSWFRSGYAGMAFNIGIVTAIVIPLSYLSHRFIELPSLRHKFRRKVEGPPPPIEPERDAIGPEPVRA